jgi:hypothetical protein
MSEKRSANQKLSEILTEDMVYHESIKVRTTDGQEHEVEVYMLSEEDFHNALETSNVDPAELGNRDKLLTNMKFMREIAKAATRDERIAAFLLPNEAVKVMTKSFEISGLTAASTPPRSTEGGAEAR